MSWDRLPMKIESTNNTPYVCFDVENTYFALKGESRPEDVRGFYQPILDEIISYFEGVDKSKDQASIYLKCDFILDYFNSSSAKYILDFLETFKKIESEHSFITLAVTWFYHAEDREMMEAGQEFEQLINVHFKYKTVE